MAKSDVRARISFPTELGYPVFFSRVWEGHTLPYLFEYNGNHYVWSGDDEEQTISRATPTEIFLYKELQRVKEKNRELQRIITRFTGNA